MVRYLCRALYSHCSGHQNQSWKLHSSDYKRQWSFKGWCAKTQLMKRALRTRQPPFSIVMTVASQHMPDMWQWQRKKREKKKEVPYFCIMPDSSIVRAFSWGAESVSVCSSAGVGFGFIIFWISVITLISDLQTKAPRHYSTWAITKHRGSAEWRVRHGKYVNIFCMLKKMWKCQDSSCLLCFQGCSSEMCMQIKYPCLLLDNLRKEVTGKMPEQYSKGRDFDSITSLTSSVCLKVILYLLQHFSQS